VLSIEGLIRVTQSDNALLLRQPALKLGLRTLLALGRARRTCGHSPTDHAS